VTNLVTNFVVINEFRRPFIRCLRVSNANTARRLPKALTRGNLDRVRANVDEALQIALAQGYPLHEAVLGYFGPLGNLDQGLRDSLLQCLGRRRRPLIEARPCLHAELASLDLLFQ